MHDGHDATSPEAITTQPAPAPRPPLAVLRTPLGRLASLSGPVLGLLAVLVLFVLLIGVKGELGSFLSFSNLQVLARDNSIRGVVALGMLLIVVSGGIDLSVGSVLALVTVVAMQVYRHLYTGPESEATASLAAVLAGIATGGACGLTNGLIITRLRVTPFVATLGMFAVARGVAVWLAERRLLAFPRGGRPGWVDSLAEVHPGQVDRVLRGGEVVTEYHPLWYLLNPGFWSLLLLAGVVAVVLRRTLLGRYCYAIGSNEATARLCGVNVERSKVWIYTLAGLLTGWAGILLFAQGGSGDPSAAEGEELYVIAAVVIGGAALTGGQGTVVGTLLGVLILAILANGVSIFNVPVEVQYILIGVIIVANTALSGYTRRDR